MTETVASVDLDKIISLCKRRGFLFQSSEIYGGIASTWDYGPLGVELKRNVKDAWWKTMVWGRDDMVGLDSAVIMNPDVWRASGHVDAFSDPLVECKACHQRFRQDEAFVQSVHGEQGEMLGYVSGFSQAERDKKRTELLRRSPQDGVVQAFTVSEPMPLKDFVNDTSQVPCPLCDSVGQFTDSRLFNTMFKTFMGPVEESASVVYLRPETAQGIFVNFNNVLNSTRKKLPFGIAQIGKAFRNEITTGSFIYRTREFEMMEIEYFVRPGEDEESHRRWIEESVRWYTDLGIDGERLRVRPHDPEELSHYSKATSDIEYHFPWGWGEIQGIANRTDYDLKAHSEASGESLAYFDAGSGERVVPYVIEPSAGVDRAVMAFLVDAYTEEEAPKASGGTEQRVVLKLHPSLAPVKVSVLPLSRNERLVPLARMVYDEVRGSGQVQGYVQYDDAQSIGRRYRRQDEIGTPLCITIDFDSLDDDAVTIRERDSMAQERVPIAGLSQALSTRLEAPLEIDEKPC